MRILILSVMVFVCVACQQKSLQHYIVKRSENPDFLLVNIVPKDILKTKNLENESTLNIIEKINVLALNKSDSLKTKKEYEEIKTILKNEEYQDLVRTQSKGSSFQVDYVGNDEDIKEVIVLINEKQKKLVLLRFIANGLNINQLSKLSSALQESTIEKENAEKLVESLSKIF